MFRLEDSILIEGDYPSVAQQEILSLLDIAKELHRLRLSLSVLKAALVVQTCETPEKQTSLLAALQALEQARELTDPQLKESEIVERALKLGIPVAKS